MNQVIDTQGDDVRNRGAVSILGRAYGRLFGRPALANLNRALFFLGGRGLGLANYESVAASGEAAFARRTVAEMTGPTVLDVGAHSGEWSRIIAEACPSAHIHAFEPSVDRAREIRRRLPNVTVVEKAVGSSTGLISLYDHAGGASEHASVLPGVLAAYGGGAVVTEVPMTTIDHYLREECLEYVDYLKIDVEGHEYSVLAGAADALTNGRVGVIQFEFNTMNVHAGRFFRDFEELLTPSYSLSRLLPSGSTLPLLGESGWLKEQFVFQNIIARPIAHCRTKGLTAHIPVPE